MGLSRVAARTAHGGLVDTRPGLGPGALTARRCKRGWREPTSGWRSWRPTLRRSRRSRPRRWRAAPPDSALGRLVHLKGVATTSASVLLDEGLVWRAFRNRRQIGGLLGFAPTKYDSGDSEHDQGISRAGNAHLQAISIQLAWNWVRWQPTSALTRWYRQHFGPRRRARRIGIVALARKLIISLWRYVTTGVVPPGAILKGAARV